MSTLISEVEDDIEKNQGEKHESISQRFDKIFDNRKKMDAFLEKLTPSMKQGLDEGCLEFSFPVNIQSGGQYNLKLEAPNTSQKLSSDTVILTVCSRYKDLSCNISRSLLINPVNEQKEAYEFLIKVFQHIIDHLKVGKKISEVYESTLA